MVRSIQSTISHAISLRTILILTYYLRLLLPTSIFPAFLNPTMRSTYPIRVIFLDFFAISKHVVKNTNYKLYIFHRLPVTSYLKVTSIFLSTLFSNALSLWSPLGWDTLFHSTKKVRVFIIPLHFVSYIFKQEEIRWNIQSRQELKPFLHLTYTSLLYYIWRYNKV